MKISSKKMRNKKETKLYLDYQKYGTKSLKAYIN